MYKFLKNFKTMDKTGLKLSLIFSLNRVIKQVILSQFLIVGFIFMGHISRFILAPANSAGISIIVVAVMILEPIRIVSNNLQGALISLVRNFIFGFSFLLGYQVSVTEITVKKMFFLFLLCCMIYLVGKKIQHRIFNAFLFKNVIDKNYLGIRKFTDPLPPKNNLYNDAEEIDVDKRMRLINQNVIKKPYQSFVELSFLNKREITSIAYKITPFGKENERTFTDYDTIYYPVFTLYPFGSLERKPDFYFILVKFELSQNAAFYYKYEKERSGNERLNT